MNEGYAGRHGWTFGGGSQSCLEWKVCQFGRSLRYAVTALTDLGVAGCTRTNSTALA
jgi:hypothetical protein